MSEAKLFVLDTNVLIVDPSCIFKFGLHDVGIPMTVLEELDNIKSGERTISRDARVAVRNIAALVEGGDFQKGVDIPDGGKLFVLLDKVENDLDPSVNDNQIINHTLYIQKINKTTQQWKEVLLITNDINMRVKSNAAGVDVVQEYKSDQVIDDTKYLTKGWVRVDVGWIDKIPEDDIDRMSCGEVIFPLHYLPEEVTVDTAVNTWIFDDGDFVARIDAVDLNEEHPELSQVGLTIKDYKGMMGRSCVGILPRSIQQAIALDAITDRELDVVIMFGGAGSGKSLCGIAGASEMIVGKKRGYRYDELIFTKTSESQFDPIGFMPGTESDKLTPWSGAVYDNLEVIARESKRKDLHPLVSIDSDEGFVTLKSLTFMRGRSLNNRVLIVDEAQDLTPPQLKTILSRAGEHCKVILMGNLAQIDNQYISANNSGLTYICDKFSRWERAAIVYLESIERSPLAEFVENNFD